MAVEQRIRLHNKIKIIKILLDHDAIYKAEIARIADLSIPTVMKIVGELIDCGLVETTGKGASTGGKPPEMLGISANGRYFVGLDLSGAEMQCVLINLRGQVLSFQHRVYTGGLHGDAALSEMGALIKKTISIARIEESRVAGIGIGVPSPTDHITGIVHDYKPFDWKNYNVVPPLQAMFGKPVFVENTSRVVAVGTRWFSEQNNQQNFILISIGKGIGSAIILDGEIYRGSNNLSGELGHVIIDCKGKLCACGNRGCLETVASGKAIVAQAATRLQEGEESVLNDYIKSGKSLSMHLIFQADERGDELARDIVQQFIGYLSIGILNIINLYDVNTVFVAGEQFVGHQAIVKRLERQVNEFRRNYFGDHRVEIELLDLGQHAAAIGAAALPFHEIIQSGGTFR